MTTTRESLDLPAFSWEADYALELTRDRRVLVRRDAPGHRLVWTCDGGRLPADKEKLLGQLRNLGYLDVPGHALPEFQAPARLSDAGVALLAQWQAHPAYSSARRKHFGLRVD